ncbi:fluoride efflux transporter FluC [Apilactobacillus timberlakei]|uniref:Fluoride-specific ion channel FluC n=1 Tax=Apilactobacillus timberlakei TaxID=2008380 RepID=A0ABY2YSL7_9LACO|nr:CrcB family protein [Apilactobacillus timberlakei]TPR13248.1 CrcB family protein [Apilactobacillus timberlakei]TPR14284.1 CrcB family protein [Apilactobacillus timberlakei]TPR16537.1 CrcB family protein [Apilactobacillus timberlakei]TPR19224.1 CrcB family protein [Apilactobacillus timberlakei]TPR19597.1 CrcB family protein [Apilactobacillus timberlakei]
MILNILTVGIGAAIGSVLRFIVTKFFKDVFSKINFPIATLFINVSGSFILGLINGQLPKTSFWTVLFIAIIGGYTTFSTYMNEIVQMNLKNKILSMTYYVLTAILGIMAAFIGNILF